MRNSAFGEEPLRGQVVLITGASSGLGRASALTFAQAGSAVAGGYKTLL